MNKTLNATEMKLRNREKILNLIRRTGLSRADLARRTGLTRAAVSVIVDELISQGKITEGDKLGAGVGRRSVGLKPSPSYGFAVGVNISRKEYSLGIVDYAGEPVREERFALNVGANPLSVIYEIAERCEPLIARAAGKFLGVGVTMPGPLDRARGVLFDVPNMGAWSRYPVAETFARRLSRPAVLDNNSNAAALSEELLNPALQGKNFMELYVDSSGVGSGVMLNIDNRAINFECEFGHTSLEANGARCSCGNYGCAETLLSVEAALAYAKAQGKTFSSWKEIADGAIAGDAACRKTVERESMYLTRLLVNAQNSFPLEAVVFAGDISYRFAELFSKDLSRAVEESSIKKRAPELAVSCLKNTTIVPAANLILNEGGNPRD